MINHFSISGTYEVRSAMNSSSSLISVMAAHCSAQPVGAAIS
jgi:hypothetical protein